MNIATSMLEEARRWTKMDRGRDVVWSFIMFLGRHFRIDAGIMRYRKASPPSMNQFPGENPRIFRTWGMQHVTDGELKEMIDRHRHDFMGQVYLPQRRWFRASELPSEWSIAMGVEGIHHIGIWEMEARGRINGVLVLGRKSPVNDHDEEDISLCIDFFEIGLEMFMTRRAAEELSILDPLTLLLNRRGFMLEFERQIKHYERPCMLAVLDIDCFKTLNDKEGHNAGDKALVAVANTLKQHIDKQRGICARFGGDEFVIFGQVRADDTVASVSNGIEEWFRDLSTQVSVGCAMFGADGHDFDTCYQVADHRLYAHKARKRLSHR